MEWGSGGKIQAYDDRGGIEGRGVEALIVVAVYWSVEEMARRISSWLRVEKKTSGNSITLTKPPRQPPRLSSKKKNEGKAENREGRGGINIVRAKD